MNNSFKVAGPNDQRGGRGGGGGVASSPGRQFKFRKKDGLVDYVSAHALAIT